MNRSDGERIIAEFAKIPEVREIWWGLDNDVVYVITKTPSYEDEAQLLQERLWSAWYSIRFFDGFDFEWKALVTFPKRNRAVKVYECGVIYGEANQVPTENLGGYEAVTECAHFEAPTTQSIAQSPFDGVGAGSGRDPAQVLECLSSASA